MIKGKTNTGFEYEISDEFKDDYELLELVANVDTNPVLTPKVLIKLLGEEQTNKLKDHVRNKKGIVSTSKLLEEIEFIFTNSTIKN